MTLSVTPDPLTAGGTATVCISGRPPNSSVTVSIDDGGEQTSSVTFDVDAEGNGCGEWPVPSHGWTLANFNFGDCPQISRSIQPAPG